MSTPAPAPYDDYRRRQSARLEQAVADAEPETSPFAGAPSEVHGAVPALAAALLPRLDDLVRDLYDHPELAFAEHRSVRAVAALLAEHGVTAQVGAYGLPTALRAVAGSGSGPRVAILAEYDALPGVGHGCGHNLIAATAVGAFLVVRELVGRTGGTVELVGTPAEEGGGGKQLIIDAGGFDGVDAAIMVHPGNATRIFGTGLGMRHVDVTYHGQAAHASGAPHLGYNALDAVVTAYQSVAQLRQHILPTDRVHGIITDGGQAPNVVPERASAHFFVRSGELDTLQALSARVDAALRGAAVSTGTTVDLRWDTQPAYLPVRVNDAIASRFVVNLAGRRTFPPRSTAGVAGGSTDMGNVSHVVPAVHPNVQTAPSTVGAHTAAFADTTLTEQARDGVLDSVVGIARTVADILADADLRAEIARQFEADGGRVLFTPAAPAEPEEAARHPAPAAVPAT